MSGVVLEKSEDLKIQMLSSVLEKSFSDDFSISGQTINGNMVFAHTGFLPIILMNVKMIYEKIFNNRYSAEELSIMINNGKPVKVTDEQRKEDAELLKAIPINETCDIFFEKKDNTLLGCVARISDDDISIDPLSLSLFSSYIVENYINEFRLKNKNKNIVELDALVQDTVYQVELGNIIILQEGEFEAKRKLSYKDR